MQMNTFAALLQPYLVGINSSSTVRAYRSDIRQFLVAGYRIPCQPTEVAAYLASQAERLAVATLERRLVAIGRAHEQVGAVNPCRHVAVRTVMRGIRRVHGVAQRQALPVRLEQLRQVVRLLTRSLLDVRDRAVLLVGFAGAFRRSELVGLRYEDIEAVAEGFVLNLRRSKTDQEGKGRKVAIPRIGGPLCAVKALEAWLKVSAIKSGLLFRRIGRDGRVDRRSIPAASVSAMLKRRLSEIGVDSSSYSAHSLRAGLVTEAAKAGVPGWKIKQQTGHKSDAVLARYIRDVDVWQNNAALVAGTTGTGAGRGSSGRR